MEDFMRELRPWLTGDYISEVRRDNDGQVVLTFQDGVKNVYRIEDCTEEQVKDLFRTMKEKGIRVL